MINLDNIVIGQPWSSILVGFMGLGIWEFCSAVFHAMRAVIRRLRK